MRVDHLEPEAVGGLVATIEADHGRLDVLVNDIFGDDRYSQFDKAPRCPDSPSPSPRPTSPEGSPPSPAIPRSRDSPGRCSPPVRWPDLYAVTDVDGSRPDCSGLVESHGFRHGAPEDLDSYR